MGSGASSGALTGNYNVGMGRNVLQALTSGSNNIAIGAINQGIALILVHLMLFLVKVQWLMLLHKVIA